MIEFAIVLISISLWLAFEIWRAPTIDERTGKTIKPTKKLSDIFK
jgi:hypothetical protein